MRSSSSNKHRSFTGFLLLSVTAIAILVTVSCSQIGFLNNLASVFISCSSSTTASSSQNGSSFFLSDSSTSTPNKIPKILHFIHVSKHLLQDDDTTTAEVLNNIQDWKTLHSDDWTVELWTNQKVRAAFPDLLPLLLQIEQPRSWVANLLRYAILHRYGGVYLDTDVVPIRRLDPIVDAFDSFTVCQSHRENSARETLGPSWSASNNNKKNLQDLVVGWSKCGQACNAVIGSKPLHPALLEALSTGYVNTNVELTRRRRESGKGGGYSILFSGPPMWTEAAKRHGVPVLYPDTFYPCDWKNTTLCDTRNFQNQPTAFAMHKWAQTWLGEANEAKNENARKTEEAHQKAKQTSQKKKEPSAVAAIKDSTTTTSSNTKPSSKKKYPFELIAKAQVGREQAEYLLSFLPDNGNLLVWGLGNDSPFWTKTTTGRVIFLEDDIPSPKSGTLWYDHIMKLHPELEAYKVHYTTDVYNDYDKFMNGTKDLWNQELDLKFLSPITSDITWDVILVDAPAGYAKDQPGRCQSIYTSLKLAQKSATKLGRPVHVFVDDFNRPLERNFSQLVFQAKPNKVTTRSGKYEDNEQAHFVVESPPSELSNK